MKRIIVNILLAFLILPLTIYGRHYYYFEIVGHSSSYSGPFKEYARMIATSVLLVAPILFLLLVLLPYNLIIMHKNLSYIQKVLVFILIMVIDLCLIGSFSNIWVAPYWKNIYYLIFFIVYGFLFVSIIHLFVDQKNGAQTNQ